MNRETAGSAPVPANAGDIESLRERDLVEAAVRRRHRLLPQAVIVGLLAGLVAVAFHLALGQGEIFRNRLLSMAHAEGGWGIALIAGCAVASVVMSALLVRRYAPEASGSGIPHLKGVLLDHRRFRWFRVILVKFVSGVMGISAGLALGREGPTVQMGAAVGEACSGLPWGDKSERRVLIAAGGGAGLAAAFNAPLAGLIFVLEELRGQPASLEFFAAAVACLVSDMICRAALCQLPVFRIAVPEAPDLRLLLAFLPLGVAAGLLGVAFNKTVLATVGLGAGSAKHRWVWWLATGLALATTGLLAPELLGGGQKLLEPLMNDGTGFAPASLLLFFGARFLLSIASYGTGAAGGIFLPVLVLGALLGVAAEKALALAFPEQPLAPNAFAVVGMAGYFTGVVLAPLTGVVLMIEMTGNYELILPLFTASFAALLVADALHDLPLYDALLERDLRRRDAARA